MRKMGYTKMDTTLHLFQLKTNLPVGAHINFEVLVKEKAGLGYAKGIKYKSQDIQVSSAFDCTELVLPTLTPKTKLYLRLRLIRLGYADRKGQYVDVTPKLGLQQKFFWKLVKNGITTTTQCAIYLSGPKGTAAEGEDAAAEESECSTSSNARNTDSHEHRSWLQRHNPFAARRPSSASSSASEDTQEEASSPNSSMLSSSRDGSAVSGPNNKKARFGSLTRLLGSGRKSSQHGQQSPTGSAPDPQFKVHHNQAADLEQEHEEYEQRMSPTSTRRTPPPALERVASGASAEQEQAVEQALQDVEHALSAGHVASPVARKHRDTLRKLQSGSRSPRGAVAENSVAHATPVEPEVVQGIIASIKDDIAPFSKGEQQADGRFLTDVTLRNGQRVAVRAEYASFDQSAIKADKACVCISFAVGAWFDMYASRRLDGHTFEQLMVEGGKQWQRLCQQPDIADEYPSGMLDFECVMDEYSDRLGELLEITAQIHCKGAGSAKTTFCGAMEERKPGVYLLTCNGHCVCVRMCEDGSVQMANSLGRSLSPSCKLAHVLSCANMAEFIDLYVGMNQPEAGVVQVEIHQISVAARGGKADFIMMSPQSP